MTTRTIEARCADHIGEPFVRRCSDCDEAQRDLEEQQRTERGVRRVADATPDVTPDEMRAMRASDVLRALRNESRDRFMPEFTAADWEAAARHLMAELNQRPQHPARDETRVV
ncbi:hypothetical protein [Chryseoglobus sp. 28M-23]|uniref:hypothetical protein n=1 Tax=Chryseoglobus sp. 28M-23 TaxID=2772253 RepID=UPI001746EC7C|nr:hypothetical protein [Chryseoglobus sp. 28M-23]QOD93483.1 hypothetical protein IE160_11350 [Chryseoglobus sp. 28M-23]